MTPVFFPCFTLVPFNFSTYFASFETFSTRICKFATYEFYFRTKNYSILLQDFKPFKSVTVIRSKSLIILIINYFKSLSLQYILLCSFIEFSLARNVKIFRFFNSWLSGRLSSGLGPSAKSRAK